MTQSTFNHAHDGRVRRLVVYDHLFEGLRESLTASFDTQIRVELERCGVWVRIVDDTGVELNPKERLLHAAREIQADIFLNATWTKRETGQTAEQYSLFTLS